MRYVTPVDREPALFWVRLGADDLEVDDLGLKSFILQQWRKLVYCCSADCYCCAHTAVLDAWSCSCCDNAQRPTSSSHRKLTVGPLRLCFTRGKLACQTDLWARKTPNTYRFDAIAVRLHVEPGQRRPFLCRSGINSDFMPFMGGQRAIGIKQ